jgi:hypothetical protein
MLVAPSPGSRSLFGEYRADRVAGHLLRGYAMAPLPPPCCGAIAPDNTRGSGSPGCCVWGISGPRVMAFAAGSTVALGSQLFVFDDELAA